MKIIEINLPDVFLTAAGPFGVYFVLRCSLRCDAICFSSSSSLFARTTVTELDFVRTKGDENYIPHHITIYSHGYIYSNFYEYGAFPCNLRLQMSSA